MSVCVPHAEQGRTEDVTVKDLGLQAAQLVANASDPLAFLAAISSRFPAVVHSVSQVKVERSFRKAVEAQASLVAPGREFLLVNGVSVRTSLHVRSNCQVLICAFCFLQSSSCVLMRL